MLIGVRDPFGIRPLVLGKQGDAYVLASETCALDIVGAEIVACEMIVTKKMALPRSKPFQQQKSRFCVFEYIYFARPDSIFGGRGVYHARKAIGAELAHENPVPAGSCPSQTQAFPAALGYSEVANIPFELGIIRNHYIGRTFIQPTQQGRNDSVKMKHNANPATVRGKRVVLVDDNCSWHDIA